jgi:thioredoxin reductase (NADPH)
MDTVVGYILLVAVMVVPAVIYGLRFRKKENEAIEAARKKDLFSDGPKAQHPHIDALRCIGCGSCIDVCPEGDVLALVSGKAAIVNGYKCIGHSLCAEACPVGAIEMVMAKPSLGADVPRLSAEFETNIENMFIAGELGGLALIKNAVNQGKACVDTIAARLAALNGRRQLPGVLDLCVVGAGPAGISASLRAVESGLSSVTIEQDEVGGTVAKYPRQKLVMTSPVDIPLYGKFRKLEISKENLLELWSRIFQRTDLTIRTSEKVLNICRDDDGVFTVETDRDKYRAHAVILALGRRGTPRKLGVPGEDHPKVMYSLIESNAYTNSEILVVGGGDSAVEAAMGLALQSGNRVTMSYRQGAFSRIKERNQKRIGEFIDSGKLKVLFNSRPVEIRESSVVMEHEGKQLELANAYVWVFAGGTPPSDFLRKLGVSLGQKDLTEEARSLAK